MIKKIPFNKKKVEEERNKIAIGNNIYHARKYRGYSQSDLADLISSSQKYISEIENGEKNFSVTILYSISTALNISSDLLGKISTNWKLIEYFDYILGKLGSIDGFLKANKLCYFTELMSIEKFNKKFLGLTMKRLYRGPFTKDIYVLRDIFDVEPMYDDSAIEKISNSNKFKTYTMLSDTEMSFIDSVLEKYGSLSSEELEKLTYDTEPMKRIGATMGDKKTLHEILF